MGALAGVAPDSRSEPPVGEGEKASLYHRDRHKSSILIVELERLVPRATL